MASDTDDADRQRITDALAEVKANPASKTPARKPMTAAQSAVNARREAAAKAMADQIANGTYMTPVPFPFTDQAAIDADEAEQARLAALAADAVAAAQALAAASTPPPAATDPAPTA